MRLAISALVVLALFGLAACDQKQESTVVKTTSAAGDTTTYSVKSANGSAQVNIGPGATANMPSYLPLYPGAAVQTSVNGTGASGTGGTVIFKTSASAADVIAFYKQKTTAAGMAETMSMTSGAMVTFGAGKQGTKEAVQVVATTGSDGTSVQLVWSQS
jgi:hypothetical protein